jgi:hypothetical protein
MDSLATLLGAITGMAVLVALLVWLAITTAGAIEPFDADPAVIAMGLPSQRPQFFHP